MSHPEMIEMQELNLSKYFVDTSQLDKNQCYMVVQSKGLKYFKTKNDIEMYLVSLDPTFVYEKLSELAIHLINTGKIVDASMSKKTHKF